jgi:hypothetical protein
MSLVGDASHSSSGGCVTVFSSIAASDTPAGSCIAGNDCATALSASSRDYNISLRIEASPIGRTQYSPCRVALSPSRLVGGADGDVAEGLTSVSRLGSFRSVWAVLIHLHARVHDVIDALSIYPPRLLAGSIIMRLCADL